MPNVLQRIGRMQEVTERPPPAPSASVSKLEFKFFVTILCSPSFPEHLPINIKIFFCFREGSTFSRGRMQNSSEGEGRTFYFKFKKVECGLEFNCNKVSFICSKFFSFF